MPRKGSKKAAQSLPLPLISCRIALSGTFPGTSHVAIQDQITSLGASVAKSITDDTTHLVTTQRDYDKPSTKVEVAQKNNLHIVSLEWIENCLSTASKVPEKVYLFTSSPAGVPSQSNAPSKRNASPDSSADENTKSKPKKHKTTNDSKAKGKSAQAADSQLVKLSDVKIPLDEGCPLTTYQVYIDDNGVIYDASLNQANATANNNKFYRIQVLQHPANGDYKTWTRWGRVGEHGQSAELGDGTLENALQIFDKKFKDKSGLKWTDRGKDPKPGKYAFIERNYNSDDDDDDEDDSNVGKINETKDAAQDEPKTPEPTIPPATQQLMELIFNQQYFAATMSDLNYDANKLPLGKLSKATISRGFQALKDLSALLDDSTLAAGYGLPLNAAIEHLSNLYYTVIPHAFGRNRPPIIRSSDMLKKEIELLESLGDMKDAALIMKVKQQEVEKIHPLDRHFQGLGMQEMTPLDHSSTDFVELQKYLLNTRGSTHNLNYDIQDIFRIERQGEKERFEMSDFASVSHDRRLLWHGSRCTNFAGILSQGLRIAPPEAPVSGYMFGKGIYLADMSSKSANYCCPYISGGHALLLLCEAELGDPMQTLTQASYNAGEDAKSRGLLSTWGQGMTGPKVWKDAKCVDPSLAGVLMPDTATAPGPTDVPNAYLMYNEYICYDIAQVRLRYLFRVKM
ncbi:PARP-domain-containing protein [Glonium stellatum]|uniref:Poly [ADP-ribose] polymerase n=1 Tax=Glonium stellatum TaxID=574774 RepID=A0A8E2FBQ7_9PEZI|nr:PARP-domain-containing protein [Glonium stellatum]